MTLADTLRGLLIYARATQTALCVRACQWRYERARHAYADAITAAAIAHHNALIFVAEHFSEHRRSIPEWLKKQPTERSKPS
jgi:hypothetical protein